MIDKNVFLKTLQSSQFYKRTIFFAFVSILISQKSTNFAVCLLFTMIILNFVFIYIETKPISRANASVFKRRNEVYEKEKTPAHIEDKLKKHRLKHFHFQLKPREYNTNIEEETDNNPTQEEINNFYKEYFENRNNQIGVRALKIPKFFSDFNGFDRHLEINDMKYKSLASGIKPVKLPIHTNRNNSNKNPASNILSNLIGNNNSQHNQSSQKQIEGMFNQILKNENLNNNIKILKAILLRDPSQIKDLTRFFYNQLPEIVSSDFVNKSKLWGYVLSEIYSTDENFQILESIVFESDRSFYKKQLPGQTQESFNEQYASRYIPFFVCCCYRNNIQSLYNNIIEFADLDKSNEILNELVSYLITKFCDFCGMTLKNSERFLFQFINIYSNFFQTAHLGSQFGNCFQRKFNAFRKIINTPDCIKYNKYCPL